MNTQAKTTVKFNILNYSKEDSLFNFGMKLSIYSDKRAQEESIGWHKECHNIKYFQNCIRKDPDNIFSPHYYTLSFSYTFEYDQDEVFFAYSVPYSYSDLRNDLDEICSNELRAANMSRKSLC